MLQRKYSILASAVLAAVPLVGKAATLTYTYDGSDITFTGGTGAYVAATNTITVTAGTVIDIGVDVNVTANPNTAPATYTKVAQPAALGVTAFGLGFTTSNGNIASFDSGVDNGGVGINADFTTITEGGSITGTNIDDGSIAGGIITANIKSSTAAGVAQLSYGAGAPAELFNGLQIDTAGTGSSTITPTLTLANQAYIAYNSGGTSSTNPPVYKAITASAADTVNALPALTIVVGGGALTSQSIISLIPGTLPQSTYGAVVGAIVVTGKGNGSYNVTTANPFVTSTTGQVAVSGFSPITDKEIYALKLSSNGTAIATSNTTAISTIIADINGGNGNTASTGVTASAITGVFTSLFPGYDILLTSTAGFSAGALGTADLGFDFSSTGEQDTSVPNITVTGVAAVPEPATVAGLVIGASGLLLGRRKNRVSVA